MGSYYQLRVERSIKLHPLGGKRSVLIKSGELLGLMKDGSLITINHTPHKIFPLARVTLEGYIAAKVFTLFKVDQCDILPPRE